jgi:tight adherence protein C
MPPIDPIAIAVIAAISIFMIGASLIPARSVLTQRMEKLESIPARSVLTRNLMIEQVISDEHRSNQQRWLLEAGWYNVSPTAMTIRVFGSIGCGLVIGLLFLVTLGLHPFVLVLAALVVLLGWRIPYIILGRAIKTRRDDESRRLPDFLDLLSSSVAAGLSLNAAMIQSVPAVEGSLRQELDSCLSEIRLGRSRADALTAMADRMNEPQTTTMVTALVQAEKLGSNIAHVLQELAKDTRERRWAMAEEKAARLPILMLLPMALFMMPSLYLMIFGPVAAYLFQMQHAP